MSRLQGSDQDISVLFRNLGFSQTLLSARKESRRCSKVEESPPVEELGGQPVGQDERCRRASLPETPLAESVEGSVSA